MVGGAPMAYSASIAAPIAYNVVPQFKQVAKVKEEKKLSDPNLIALAGEISALVDSKNNRFQTSFIKNYKHLLLFKQIRGHVKVTASTTKKLSSWVQNQRTNLKWYRENDGPLCGNNKFVKLLKMLV
jgi:hypothetical protein